MHDLTNKQFGRLTALKINGRKQDRLMWLCQCECGNFKEVSSKNLMSGYSSSCGCLQTESAKKCIQDVLRKRANYTEEQRTDWINKSVQTKKETLYNDGVYVPHLTKSIGKNNKSGVKGVSWDKSRSKWKAEIALNGERKHLGRFDTIEEAKEARRIAEELYFAPILEEHEEKR